MECDIIDDGPGNTEPAPLAARARGLKRKLQSAASRVQLHLASAVPGAPPHRQVHVDLVSSHQLPNNHSTIDTTDYPFISNMDEISYWIHTKRAPCLMNYDNLFKKSKDAQCSKPKPKSVHSVAEEELSPKKKKKRKLSLLDDGSASPEKQQNVYFEATQQQQRAELSSYKSDTLHSDIDFNIKNSSIQVKPKRTKLQKNNQTILHKKTKVVTSTPKVKTALRRSLRKAQNGLINNSHFNVSYQVYNTGVVNGSNIKDETKYAQLKTNDQSKTTLDKLVNGYDNSLGNKKIVVNAEKLKTEATFNGKFEDLSDVSGFTANYIRSTKIHSTKISRNLRSKGSRNLMKHSQQKFPNKEDSKMMVCVTKSMNTAEEGGRAALLHCSSDSSQNIINLITTKNNAKSTGIDKSTSLLKFVDAKNCEDKRCDAIKLDSSKPTTKIITNISFLSRSRGTSRYPKRHKNFSSEDVTAVNSKSNQSCRVSPNKRRKVSKNFNDYNNSHRKENPDDQSMSKTRSGRNIGLTVRQQDNSVLVFSNSTEQVSSVVTVNVAGPTSQNQSKELKKKKKHMPSVKYVGRAKKSVDKSVHSLQKDPLRDKSGFSACFSDSEDDSAPLKQRKYFC